MPFRGDPHSQNSSRWTATIVCGCVLGALAVAGMRSRTEPLPVLKVPARRPAAASGTKSQPKRKPQPQIRVSLASTPQAKLKVAVKGPYVVRTLDKPRTLTEGQALAETELTIAKTGFHLGSQSFARQPVEIAPKSTALVSINGHAYHGSVRIYPQASGKLTAVNVLPLEEYVSCVIDAEMPAKFPPAAREAQAIVARTYALWQMRQADPAANYDVFATVRSQKYLGAEYVDGKGRRLAGESASSRAAAAATRGLVCQANGRLFCTYYSAVCGGATTPGSEIFSDADAVLKSVPCRWCRDSDKYRWRADVSAEELLAAVRKEPKGKELSAVRQIRQTAGPQAGAISQFEIGDGRRTVSISGTALRQHLPTGKLLSPHFSLTPAKGNITVDGQGFGHGAGLCQWGARGLAESGKSAREIVQYYYPGATVTAHGY